MDIVYFAFFSIFVYKFSLQLWISFILFAYLKRRRFFEPYFKVWFIKAFYNYGQRLWTIFFTQCNVVFINFFYSYVYRLWICCL